MGMILVTADGDFMFTGNHVTKNKMRTATIWMDEFSFLAKVWGL